MSDLDRRSRDLLASAASDGLFEELSELTPIAREISALAAKWGAANLESPQPLVASQSELAAVSQRAKVKDRRKKGEFPQFLRERDELVKVGRSSGGQGLYEHRAPKTAVDSVVKVAHSKGSTGHRFSMAEILEAIAGEEVPTYQAYAAILWLKWNGLLLQHGRQGYTIVHPREFMTSVDTAWETLPRR